MITNTFDPATTAKLNPFINPDAVKVDACIITFSYVIEKFVKETYDCEQICGIGRGHPRDLFDRQIHPFRRRGLS